MNTPTGICISGNKYERRRGSIMHAAAAVFAEKGFHGASTHDIAERVGMKQGSLYYYFPSKDSALEAICLFAIGEKVARLKLVLDSELSLPKKIRQVVHDQLHGMKARCDHRIVFMEQRRYLPAEPRERIRAFGREYRHLLVGMLRDAQQQGAVAADLDVNLAARALIGLCDSVAPWYQQDDSLDTDTVADQYARMFYSGIQPIKKRR